MVIITSSCPKQENNVDKEVKEIMEETLVTLKNSNEVIRRIFFNIKEL